MYWCVTLACAWESESVRMYNCAVVSVSYYNSEIIISPFSDLVKSL